MTEPLRVARMLAESLALQVAQIPETLCDDAEREGMHPRLVAGLRAARAAFAETVREGDADELWEVVLSEVRTGLAELDATRRHTG
jgi:hypothetical protein